VRYQAALRTDVAAYHNAFHCDCNARDELLALTALILTGFSKISAQSLPEIRYISFLIIHLDFRCCRLLPCH
jgi:hypothetical protein